MKSVFKSFLFFSVFSVLVFYCQSASQDNARPEKVYRIVYVQKSNDWYQKQAELWKKEVDKNPENPEAWENYYNAVRYARFVEMKDSKDKQARLEKIIEDMGKAVPETYQYYLLKYRTHHTLLDISDLKKAYTLAPEKPGTYYGFISHYEYSGNQEKMTEFLTKLYKSADITPMLLNYNYNVLMSVEENGLLFTNGDNDTYPLWVLQKVKGVRAEVTVLNASLVQSGKEYLKRKLAEKNISIDFGDLPDYGSADFIGGLARKVAENYPEIPVYFALTVYEDYTKSLKDDLYIVGLAYQYHQDRLDNLALLKRNMEMKFRMDYLDYEWYAEDYPANSFVFLNMNYVPPLLMLARHYQLSGEKERSRLLTARAMELGRSAGREKEVIQYIREKGI